ncbi:MAG: class I SAM-dependent methyltransferase [Deltaproteobacteria bacterium]|nr:class I SAM-dependent methyltransferase [Deltaproteobacteria bacterium]
MGVHVCPWWLAYTFDHRLRLLVHNPLKLFGKYVLPDMTVVDLGCGLGFNTMGMAKLVGDKGRVVALDIQQEMLDGVMRRAGKMGLERRIEPHLATETDLRLKVDAQFILAFYMVHEVPDQDRFLAQVADNLSAKGRFMMVEPPLHVSEKNFQKSIAQAEKSGLLFEESYKILFGKTAVFTKPAILK